ncbi:class I SAM-dependent methyltransferase [Paenibacillus peoriae]|uniref:class I SAM-dependent methyltransferase n=1 Tax=Paenibacillus peoriae TaxID=59893 RepID=UPI00026C633F|nr:class I SAM-dependent methyltransferase [Paenibacillus peoriae]MEC0182210.1 class I SAM-dependent methyltransferase [Paenibacillus peoriae]
MTKFYQVLTPYYDEIFPANDKQISFLSSCFPAASTLLDVGAGTGNTAIALTKAGYILTAAEPEQSMTVKIKEKANRDQLHIKVMPNSMQQIPQLNETFDGIYCIGNTLAHLDNFNEICTFLQAAYDMLNEQGKLVIQTVNFENVLRHQKYSFPLIQKDTFTFTRKYEPLDHKIRFTTILEDHSDTHSNAILLYPVTKAQLQNELLNCGFHSISVYGDYGKSPYSIESPALVIIASK